jgi:O-antigen biosynthesis protein WbqP
MIRFLDLIISFVGIIFFLPLLILIFFISSFKNNSPFFFQKRVGQFQKSFVMIKFRTMPLDTKSVGTHLINERKLSNYHRFLRKTKIDEIPQLFNVFLGDMSLVGPRPCLVNQKKLISERKKKGVFKVKPGITGLAQIAGITMKNPTLVAKTDMNMLKQLNLYYYFYYIISIFFIFFKKDK